MPPAALKMTPFLRSSLLNRPPTLRLSSLLHLPPAVRLFHATPRAQFLDTALLGTQAVLDSVHTFTGLPWVYTLPLSALLVRLTIVLPVTLYHRKLMQKQISLFPLLSAWRHVLQKQTMEEVGHRGPHVATNMLLRKVRSKRAEIYKRAGVESWKNMSLPFVQLPVFLVVIETIRKMCGREEGLAGILWGRVGGLFPGSNEVGPETGSLAVEEVIRKTVEIESSLASEGALWFPDLLVADPQIILPFVLSGAILVNIFGRIPSAGGATVEKKWQRRAKRIFGTLALAVGPLTVQVPSAMLVYWISSTTLAYLQAVALELWAPLKKSVRPCEPKRPLKNALGPSRRGVSKEI